MKWTKTSDAVYTTTSGIVKANTDDINMLKSNIFNTPDKRIRICAHQHPEEQLHEMLIVFAKETYIRPHKHVNKSESFHVIEGLFDVIIFADDGTILQVIPMGDATSGRNFFYRLSVPYFHTLFLRTDWVVLHETTNGPFKKDETIYPEWSPDAKNDVAVKKFIVKLEHDLNGITLG